SLGPALSQKKVDHAEGLAQGLAGLTEQRAQHLEDEILRRFGPGPEEDERGDGPDPWREETDRTAKAAPPTGAKAEAGPDSSAASQSASAKQAKPTFPADFDSLFDCFRTEINAAAGRAGLTPNQIDRARDVLVQACSDLKDIFNDRH
ncbi:MAG: hypothetical protein HOV68_28490, partial [Streptomycetaceae bacterium]|nr:hypothetical protein [Streptomycetaceae bacterium]